MKLNREAISNLEQNRCVATSLKNYASDMTALTWHAGIVLAAMNGYGMYDRICDEECDITAPVRTYFEQLCAEMERTILTRCRGMEFQMGCGRLEALRNAIIRDAQKAEEDSELLEQYALLMETLNPVYAAFLVTGQAGKAEKDIRSCMELLKLIVGALSNGNPGNIEEEAMPFLISMEGLQERYYQPLYRYQLAFQDILDGFSDEIRKKDLTGSYDVLDKTRKLLSSSPFAPL
ncbi:MAG: hypothetical protein ACI4D3_06640 [Lachnospiraceae bacterium]